jgi:low affinity Fe/Cu permease
VRRGGRAHAFRSTLLRNHAGRRSVAVHAKLDELLRAHGDADEQLTKLDREEPEEIEKRRGRAMR